MGRKSSKRPKEVVQRPWCYYCDREFESDGILMQHQKARHFGCEVCRRKCGTVTSLGGHMWHVHQRTLERVPHALPDRDALPKNGGADLVGMLGVPEGFPTPLERWAQRQQEEAEQAALQEQEEARAAEEAEAEAEAKRQQEQRQSALTGGAGDGAAAEGGGAANKRPATWGGGFSLGSGGGGGQKKARKLAAFAEVEPAGGAAAPEEEAEEEEEEGLGGVVASPEGGQGQPAGAEAAGGPSTGAGMNEAAERQQQIEERGAAAKAAAVAAAAARRYKGVVKTYNSAKGFGFITYIPDASAEQKQAGLEPPRVDVSRKRLLDESPWLQLTSECQRF
jgi:hypothetical protein